MGMLVCNMSSREVKILGKSVIGHVQVANVTVDMLAPKVVGEAQPNSDAAELGHYNDQT